MNFKEMTFVILKTTQVRLSEKKSSPTSKKRRPVEISLCKRAGCQKKPKPLEKSIVARIVQEPGLDSLNPSMDWER